MKPDRHLSRARSRYSIVALLVSAALVHAAVTGCAGRQQPRSAPVGDRPGPAETLTIARGPLSAEGVEAPPVGTSSSARQFPPASNPLRPVVIYPERADVSPPLRSIPYTVKEPGAETGVMPDLEPPKAKIPKIPFEADPVVQDFFGSAVIPPTSVDWEAINNLNGVLPPDTNGDVGPNHYVQMVNTNFAAYDRVGNEILAPVPINTLWAGFGGPCESDNSGDPVVLYDHLADRWVLSQFAITTGMHECVAVSTSGDPTGSYYRYAFDIGGFPDYPKLGVWADSYLATYRNFGAGFDMQAAGYNRVKMLVGDPTAEAVLFSMSSAFEPLGIDAFLPADLDGPAPPAGTDAPFMGLLPDEIGFPQDALAMFELDVDWANPGGATLNGPTILPVEPFLHAMCSGDNDCIPQPGTAQGLDAIADRLLHRLVYRDFGYYQAMVALHTVNAGTAEDKKAGERWYELRDAGSAWGVYQQGTYAPDADHRWMGSIAMDGAGNIAMGYSVSSDTVFPSIRYTGRLVTDPLGIMPQGEGEIIAGTGAQTDASGRWGDYSAMSIDPVDDCTFWYTTEYIETTGERPWQTRVGAFAFSECPAPAFDDFSIWAQPQIAYLCAPDAAVFNVTAFQIGSYGENVSLSVAGVPDGYSASFDTNSVVPPDSATLTLSNVGVSAAGQYQIDVIGMGSSATHTSTVTLELFPNVPIAPTLVSPVEGAANQSVRPVLTWNAGADAIEYLVEVASDAGFTAIVDSATVTGASYQVSVNLDFDTTYYWRVAANNTCGIGSFSAVSDFTVTGDGTTCPAGMSIVYDYLEDFDSGAAGWTHSAVQGPDTWGLQDANPSPGSGGFNYHADDYPGPSDQRLVSPLIALPSGATLLTMQFLNYQSFENPNGSGGCWDGGTLEISNDGGSSWTRLDAELLSDPYDGKGNNGPPAGVNMWCGETDGVQPWFNSTVDMSAYDGQSVQFRFSSLSDAASGAPGWNIDDVTITHCAVCLEAPIPPAPGGSPQLSLLKTGTDTELSWSSVPDAVRYDVIVGDLAALQSGHGDFSLATNECLGTDLTATVLTHSADPPAGGGYWFLVRGANCAGVGEYDSGSPGQSGSRDGEVAASGNDCGSPPSSISQWASTAFASSEYSSSGNSALQATGPPDTLECGDFPTAWAPLDPGTGPEWLEVGYDTPVMATGVDVYETYVGSFIYQVDARLQSGSLQTVWTGTDDTPCYGVFHATWPAPAEPVTGLRIHTQIADWEEIDAVRLLGNPAPATTVSAFTGGDPGEGLDFAGTFLYAVNVRGPGGFSVGDAVFTDDSAPGVTWVAEADILNWTAPEYGDTTDDNNLEVVMQSIRWSAVPQGVTYTLGGLTPGASYKLQLLFYEGCCERGFDVFVDGNLVVDEFAPYQVHGGIDPSGSGAVITHTFDAQSTSVEIVLSGNDATFPDRNPALDGLTLELVGGGP